jgi:hypothetical protein
MSSGVLLVIEDGTEYEEFARAFLDPPFSIAAAHSAKEALDALTRDPVALLLDMRFERTLPRDLLGDVDRTAERLFGGDKDRARRHLVDQQGALVLAALREARCDVPAVFVHDFPERRLDNLRKLYGRVGAVSTFDAARILETVRRLA